MKKLVALLLGLLILATQVCNATETNIIISAQSQWVSTGVTISPETAVTIEATGEWCGAPWSCYGPEGTGGIAPSIFLAPGLSSGGLVGKVGNNSPFLVGSMCSFKGQDHGTGTLYLAFNDEITGYYNNSGSLDVTITTNEEGGNILVYATSEITYGYTSIYFDEDLPSILAEAGFSATVTDRIATPVITSALLEAYDELWILSTDPFSGSGCFSNDEINAIFDFRNTGKGILIMPADGPPGHDYTGDANQVSSPLGVTFSGQYNYGPFAQPFEPDFSPHPLFTGVQTIVCTGYTSKMDVSSPSQVVATFEGKDLIAVLDDGMGRVVFDVSFIRLWDDDSTITSYPHLITVGDNPQYVKNIANWLADGGSSPQDNPPQVTLISPNGFEIFKYPETVNIQWQASDDHEITAIDISFSTNNGHNWSVEAENLTNTGSFAWSISPLPEKYFDRCKIRIRATDSGGQYSEDTSDENFMVCNVTSGGCGGGEIEAMGECPTEAIVGDGRITANFSKEGRLVALWYPTPGAYNQIDYLTLPKDSAKCKRFLGAHPYQGSFAGIRIDGDRFSWLMNSSWNVNMNYEQATGVLNIWYQNPDLQLKVLETSFVPPDKNTLVRHYEIINQGPTRSIDFVYYGQFNSSEHDRNPDVYLSSYFCPNYYPVLEEMAKLDDSTYVSPSGLYVDSAYFQDGNNHTEVVQNKDIVWSHPGSGNTIRLGIESSTPDIKSEIQQVNTIDNPQGIYPGFGVYSDTAVVSYGEMICDGRINGYQEVSFGDIQEDGSTELTVFISCGDNYDDATQKINFCRLEGYNSLLTATSDWWNVWLTTVRQKPAYNELNPDEQSLLERLLITLRMLQDRRDSPEAGGIVASPNQQPKYYGSWPRDGVFQATALALAGYDPEALKFYKWLFNRTDVLQSDNHWLQTYSIANATYQGLPWGNLVPYFDLEGVIEEDQMPIVLWGLWMWTEITGKQLPSYLPATKIRNVANYVRNRIVNYDDILLDPYKYVGLLEPSLDVFEVPMLRDVNGFKKEKFGIAQSLWTNSAAVAGLQAASKLLNDPMYSDEANRIKQSITDNLSSYQHGYYTRRSHIGELETAFFLVCGEYVGDVGLVSDRESDGMFLTTPFFSVFDEDCNPDTKKYRKLIADFLESDNRVFMPQYLYSAIHDYHKYGDATRINRLSSEFTTSVGYLPDVYSSCGGSREFGASRPLGWTQALGVIALLLKGGAELPSIIDHSPCQEVNQQAENFIGQLFESVTEIIGGTINQGEQIVIEFVNEAVNNLVVLLHWNGSELRLKVFKPDGSLYKELQSTNPPIFLIIPSADIGEWTFEVTGVDVPYDFYPFVMAFGEPKTAFGSISGSVVIEPDSSPACGITIDVTDDLGTLVASGVTDENGQCEFGSLGIGDYIVTIVSPLGYQAVQEDMAVLVMPDQTTPADFILTPLEIIPQQRSRAYWAHQLHKAIQNKPKDYTLEDFSNFVGSVNFLFNQNQINSVDFYSVPQPATRADSLDALASLLHMRTTDEDEHLLKRQANAQLMALLLNVVAGKVHQTHEISEDGRTISQLITYCDMLVGDEIDPPDDSTCPGHGSHWFRYIYASFMLVKANLGISIPAGMVPEDVIQIAYKLHGQEQIQVASTSELQQNYPNPFNAATEISFTLPSPAYVKLDIFNIMGQKIANLIERPLEAGEHKVRWDAGDSPSGIYFYRLDAGEYVETRKMILLK